MSEIQNILPRFIENGKLTEDFSSFSDDELRLGLMMIIDNLEAYEDAVNILVDFTKIHWREAYSTQAKESLDKRWASQLEMYTKPAEEELEYPSRPWDRYNCTHNEEVKTLDQLDRDTLLKEIGFNWSHLQRAAQASELLAKLTGEVNDGKWFDPRVSPLETNSAPPPPTRKAKKP